MKPGDFVRSTGYDPGTRCCPRHLGLVISVEACLNDEDLGVRRDVSAVARRPAQEGRNVDCDGSAVGGRVTRSFEQTLPGDLVMNRYYDSKPARFGLVVATRIARVQSGDLNDAGTDKEVDERQSLIIWPGPTMCWEADWSLEVRQKEEDA